MQGFGNNRSERVGEKLMDMILNDNLCSAVWVAHSLFERGKTSGASANMSFRYGDTI